MGWGAGGMGAAAAIVACVALAGEIPTKDFARKTDYETAKISPDGAYIATAMLLNDQRALGVIDIKSRKMISATRFSHGNDFADYWWVGPSRIAFALGHRGGPLDQLRLTGELEAMDADGKHETYLFGYRGAPQVGSHLGGAKAEHAFGDMLDALPADPMHALIAVMPWSRGGTPSYPILNLVDVVSGNLRRVDAIPVYAPYEVAADEDGKPRYVSGRDSQGRVIDLARASRDSDWTTLGSATEEPAHRLLYHVTRDGRAVYLSSTQDSDRSCLRKYEFATARSNVLSCHPIVDVGRVTFMSYRGDPVAVTYEVGKPETVPLAGADPGDAKLLKLFENTFASQRVVVASRTLDGKKAVLIVDSDRNPGDVYLFDLEARKAEFLFARRSWIDPEKMRPVEPIQFKARDGTAIYGYLTLPADAAGPGPLVLIPHGGPHGVRDLWRWDAQAQFLASRGYAVLQVNYRGSGGYGAAFERAGYRKWGTLMQDDLADGARWAIARKVTQPGRVCISGGSWGGYAALMSAVREPDLYRCAVGFAGVYDLRIQASDSDTAQFLYGREYLARVLGTDPAELAAQSPITYVDKLKANVLIAHGTADKRVPFSQAKALRKALDEAHKPYEWLEFDGEEHGFWKDQNHELFLNKVKEFLDKNIGPGAAPAAH
jgi:dipeptidyl aminopeptidase/acylaminoacyl peptidase